MDNAFFSLIPNLDWATGDINYNDVINFDDYSAVDEAFFFQGAPLVGVECFCDSGSTCAASGSRLGGRGDTETCAAKRRDAGLWSVIPLGYRAGKRRRFVVAVRRT